MQHLNGARRLLQSSPGYCAVVVVTLALALTPVLVTWGFLDALIFRPLPFPAPEEVVIVLHHDLQRDEMGLISLPEYYDLALGNAVDLAVFKRVSVTLGQNSPRQDEMDRLGAALVSANFFDVLGMPPAAGRFFVPGEDLPGAPRTVVLTERLARRYGLEVGAMISLDAQLHRLVGLVPNGFELPLETEVWIPINERFHGRPRFDRFLNTVARLDDGVSMSEASQRFSAAAAMLQERFPQPEFRFAVKPYKSAFTAGLEPALGTLLAVALLVLLAAAANAANLALAHTAERDHEMAVRSACGADPNRLRRQILIEHSWLTAAGGVGGLILAVFTCRIIHGALPLALPEYLELRVDFRGLLIAGVALAVAHGILSLLPAELARRRGLSPQLQSGARSSARALQVRWRRRFVTLQATLAFVLVTAAVLLLEDAWRLAAVEPGLDDDDVVLMQMALPLARYPELRQAALFWRQLQERLETLPGVGTVALAAESPVAEDASGTGYILGAADGSTPRQGNALPINYQVVTPGYFQALDIVVLAGRGFEKSDQWGQENAVVINQGFLTHILGDTARGSQAAAEEILGRPIWVAMTGQWGRIVGVVGDVRHSGLHQAAERYLYLAQDQYPWRDLSLVLEMNDSSATTAKGLAEIAAAVQREAATLDPHVPVFEVRSLGQRVADLLFFQRVALGLIVVLGLTVLVLTVLGLFGTTAIVIERERHAMAIRMALGRTSDDLRSELLRRTLKDLTLAVVVGGALAVAGLPWLESLLAAGRSTAPLALGVTLVLLLGTAAAAVWLASRRVTAIEPADIFHP